MEVVQGGGPNGAQPKQAEAIALDLAVVVGYGGGKLRVLGLNAGRTIIETSHPAAAVHGMIRDADQMLQERRIGQAVLEAMQEYAAAQTGDGGLWVPTGAQAPPPAPRKG